MIYLLKMLRGIYYSIAGSGNPMHIALGVWLGVLASLHPLGAKEPMTWLLLYLTLCTRAGIGIFLCTLAVVKSAVAAGGSNVVESFGVLLLERVEGLRPFWERALDLPVIAFFELDRYAAMGGAVLGVGLGAALFFPVTKGVVAFRERLVPRMEKSGATRWLNLAGRGAQVVGIGAGLFWLVYAVLMPVLTPVIGVWTGRY